MNRIALLEYESSIVVSKCFVIVGLFVLIPYVPCQVISPYITEQKIKCLAQYNDKFVQMLSDFLLHVTLSLRYCSLAGFICLN